MEFGRSNDLCQLFHISRLYVDNVEALVLYVQIPQVYTQVITADEGFSVTIHRYAVDMVGMCIGVGSPRHGGNDSIVVCHAWEFKICLASEREMIRSRSATSPSASRSQVMREIVFGNNLQRLFKDFPKLYCFVIR